MGHGNYSYASHAALIADRATPGHGEVFKQHGCHAMMDPRGLKVRESRDSADHPNSLAIAFALDVTGSMGHIPRLLAQQELPTFMKLLTACNIADPQILFMAIGDANADRSPLQVGQFESTAALMDQWLTWSHLEGGGGGTNQESYELAFYVLAKHTDTDCFEKHKKRGYLFMTGDEEPYPQVSRIHIEALTGEKLDDDIPIDEVIAAAAESYHLFFLIPDLQRRHKCEARWRELLGDHVICLEGPQDTCAAAAAIVALTEGALPGVDALVHALEANGIAHERTGAVVRALTPYADLLKPGAAGRLHTSPDSATSAATGTAAPGVAKARPAWWRRLLD